MAILIADDDLHNINDMKKTLEPLHGDVITAMTLDELRTFGLDERITAIVSDLSFVRHGDALNVLAELKAKRPTIYIIATSETNINFFKLQKRDVSGVDKYLDRDEVKFELSDALRGLVKSA